MKISKTQLKEIIKEELEAVMSEEDIGEGIFDMFKKKKKAAPAPEPEEEEEEEEWKYTPPEPEPRLLTPQEVQRQKEKEEREFRIAQYQAYGDRDDKPKKSRAPAGGYGRYQGSGYGSPSAPWNESKKKLTKE